MRISRLLTLALSLPLAAAPPAPAGTKTPAGKPAPTKAAPRTPATKPASSLAARVQELEGEVRALRQELVTIAAVANFRAGDKATFDPTRPSIARLDTDVGSLAVTLEPLESATGGTRLVLVIGNPGSADIGGAQLYVSWGKSGVSWSDTSPSATLVPPNDLVAGAWTRLATFLQGVTPTDVGWVEVRMSASAIKLRKP